MHGCCLTECAYVADDLLKLTRRPSGQELSATAQSEPAGFQEKCTTADDSAGAV